MRLLLAMIAVVLLGVVVAFVVGGGDGCSTRRDGNTKNVCRPAVPSS